MKPNEPSESCPADRSSDDAPLQNAANPSPPSDAGAKSRVPPKPLSIEAAEAVDADPFWVPAGVQIDGWSPALRSEIAMLINPIYNELVLLARPGLAQSIGLTIVHLMWLEILDQMEIARAEVPDRSKDPLQIVAYVSGAESRKEIIERHLRLVHAKLKASDFLLRLNEFGSSFWRAKRDESLGSNHSNFPRRPRPLHEYGKNDFR